MKMTRFEKQQYLLGFAKGYEISMKCRHAIEQLDPKETGPLATGLRAGFEAHEKDWAAETHVFLQSVHHSKPLRPFKVSV